MEIKCPRCDAPMEYDLTKRLLVCAYCGYETEPDTETKASYEAMVPKGANEEEKNKARAELTDKASCSSCGAVLMRQKNLFSHVCPYCGSVLIATSDAPEIMPDGVIPFMVDRTGVDGALRFPISNNALIPSDFKSVNTAENMNEFFMSMWLFDIDTSAEFEGHWNNGKRFHKDKKTHGHFEKFYESVAICGTKKHGLGETDVTEAFRYTEIQNFSPEFLAGHPAELPDVSVDEALMEARERIFNEMKEDITERIISHYEAAEADVDALSIDYNCESAKLIFVPMWGKENVYGGKSYPTLVSGQTGQYCGAYPSSWANFGKGMFDLFARKK